MKCPLGVSLRLCGSLSVVSETSLADTLRIITTQHRVYHFEGSIDLVSHFGACQHDLAADEDQQDNFRLNHAINEAREEFRLVGAEVVMARGKSLQANGELDVARTNNVLNLKIREFRIEPKFLDNASVFARSKSAIVFRLCTSHNHLARSKDEGRCFGLANAHDHSGETLDTCQHERTSRQTLPYLRIVLRITRVQCDGLQIQSTVEIDRCHDVSETCH